LKKRSKARFSITSKVAVPKTKVLEQPLFTYYWELEGLYTILCTLSRQSTALWKTPAKRKTNPCTFPYERSPRKNSAEE